MARSREEDAPRIRVPMLDAIECMVYVLGPSKEPLLLCSTIDEDGFVGPGDSFSLVGGPPSVEVLFELPRRLGAAGVLFGSSATRSVFDPDEADTLLFQHLQRGADATGIPLVEHVLVDNMTFRLMKESQEGRDKGF